VRAVAALVVATPNPPLDAYQAVTAASAVVLAVMAATLVAVAVVSAVFISANSVVLSSNVFCILAISAFWFVIKRS